jgi:hypothetical protein
MRHRPTQVPDGVAQSSQSEEVGSFADTSVVHDDWLGDVR